MKISLLGYMGAGKSMVGKYLSKISDIPFIDLDDYISARENKTIAAIFKTHGEIHFRKLENHYLQEVLKRDKFVLATGGGTPVFYNHIELLKAQSTTFYLHASPDVLALRLTKEKSKRPLIAHLQDQALEEYIAKHLFERNAFYQQAHYTLSTQHQSIAEIAQKIKFLNQSHQNLS